MPVRLNRLAADLIKRENARPGTRVLAAHQDAHAPRENQQDSAQRTLPLDRGLLLRQQRAGRGEVADHGEREPGVRCSSWRSFEPAITAVRRMALD